MLRSSKKDAILVIENKSDNNKRIIKNTLLLYIRSLIVMVVALYTSRVILSALGVEDYGLYNVIGGVVSLFAFLRTSMTKSTQRFLNVEMTRDSGRLKDTFRVSFTIHMLLAIVALVLAETIGLWFLNSHIQIPEGREFAANVVYQSTIGSLILTILSVPFNAAIIAHERMGYFAVVSIFDSILKLIICYLIMVDGIDRLILYGWLMMLVNVANFLLYAIYCFRNYVETSIKYLYDRVLFKEIFSYTTWTVVGSTAVVATNQGNNILVNMFHTVSANAAMGIASQVNSAVVSLTSNFQTAFNPQITKSYATHDFEYLKRLVYSTSKLSYYLLFLISLPLFFNMDLCLSFWLKEVPPYAGIFSILMLCNAILNALSMPFNYAVLSTSNIKWFQIVTSLVFLSDLVIVYSLFCLGAPAFIALAVKVSIMVVMLGVRLFFANKVVECINIWTYTKEALLPIIIVTFMGIIIGFALYSSWLAFMSVLPKLAILMCMSTGTVYFWGLTESEKHQITKLIGNIRSKF